MATIEAIEQDGAIVQAVIASAAGQLTAIFEVKLLPDRIILSKFHVEGPGPGTLGVQGLRAIIRAVMEHFDVSVVEIQGFKRTTGALPGRLPKPLVFRR